MDKVLVVVLNYKRPDDTIECVRSVLASDHPDFHVAVVDNASGDDSAVKLKRELPSKVTLFLNDANLGYAGGNNVALRKTRDFGCRHALVLNNDTAIAADALSRLAEAAERRPDATLIGPKVYFYDRPDVINSFGTTVNWLKHRPNLGHCGTADEGQFTASGARQILPGSALFFTEKLIQKTGLFDERYFLIHEDADLCLRNIRAGGLNWLAADAHVRHKASLTLSAYPFRTAYYSARNFLYLAAAHAGSKLPAVYAGLAALSAKHAFRLSRADDDPQKIRARGFFEGVKDYFAGKTGEYAGKAAR